MDLPAIVGRFHLRIHDPQVTGPPNVDHEKVTITSR
ncbi:hypothetical protein HDA40_003562 [Hamadaea flava]|nr:hypothetical protein [Hamadaea flava]